MIQEIDKIDPSTGEIKKVNTNFFQVYKDNVNFLIDMNKENKTALNIFLWIAKNMDDKNALVVSQEALSNVMGVTTRTIQSAIAYLKEKKALEIIKSGTSNVYALNSKIVWQDEADNKKYAHFTAKVYVTLNEQENKYKSELYAHSVEKKTKNKPKSNLPVNMDIAINNFQNA